MEEKVYFGLGLSELHYKQILAEKPKSVDLLEIMSESYMISGGLPLYYLGKIKDHYPIVMHGVSMSLGSTDPLNAEYLKKLKNLADWIKPLWIADYLCWTGIRGINSHDLLPLPYTEEALNHVCQRIVRVQDYFGRRIVIENVSSYVDYNISEMTEWEFLSEVAKRADCYLLLNINNVFVNSFNHNFDPYKYINAIPSNRIKQYHLAGDSLKDEWELYQYTLKKHGIRHLIMERDDDNLPDLNELINDLNKARMMATNVLKEARNATTRDTG